MRRVGEGSRRGIPARMFHIIRHTRTAGWGGWWREAIPCIVSCSYHSLSFRILPLLVVQYVVKWYCLEMSQFVCIILTNSNLLYGMVEHRPAWWGVTAHILPLFAVEWSGKLRLGRSQKTPVYHKRCSQSYKPASLAI